MKNCLYRKWPTIENLQVGDMITWERHQSRSGANYLSSGEKMIFKAEFGVENFPKEIW